MLVRAGSVVLAAGVGLAVFALSWQGAEPEPSGTGSAILSSAVEGGTPTATATPPTATTSPDRPRKRSGEPDRTKAPTTGTDDTLLSTPEADPAPEQTRKTRKPTPSPAVTPDRTEPVTEPTDALPVVTRNLRIRNQSTGRCADLPEYGTGTKAIRIRPASCAVSARNSQEHDRIRYGAHDFSLRSERSGLCWDVAGSGSVPVGSGIFAYACFGGESDNQTYRSTPSKSGVKLVNVKTSLCVDLSPTSASSRWLVLAKCSSAPTQIWKFV